VYVPFNLLKVIDNKATIQGNSGADPFITEVSWLFLLFSLNRLANLPVQMKSTPKTCKISSSQESSEGTNMAVGNLGGSTSENEIACCSSLILDPYMTI
jgi:hypothetical protein